MNWFEFDPYDRLCENTYNIVQLSRAFNTQSEVLEQLTRMCQHQQQVIEQLQHNDRRLQRTINLLEQRLNSSP